MISRVNIIGSTINKRLFSNNSILRSHIGSLPINFNKNIISLDNHTTANNLIIKGELGQLSIKIHPFVNLIYSNPTATTTTTTAATSTTASAGPPSDSTLTLSILDPSIKHQRAIWGLTRSLISNAIQGVSNGYSLSLRLVGVGYRATLEPSPTPTVTQRLNLKLGYAHPVLIDLPSDVQALTPSTTVIELKGIDKQRLGEVAARIRRWRVPEPYNVSLVRSPSLSSSLGLSTYLASSDGALSANKLTIFRCQNYQLQNCLHRVCSIREREYSLATRSSGGKKSRRSSWPKSWIGLFPSIDTILSKCCQLTI